MSLEALRSRPSGRDCNTGAILRVKNSADASRYAEYTAAYALSHQDRQATTTALKRRACRAIDQGHIHDAS